jgi:hypothetical protein
MSANDVATFGLAHPPSSALMTSNSSNLINLSNFSVTFLERQVLRSVF